jgi:hypothetical protein
LDVHKDDYAHLAGRWTILVDLGAEFRREFVIYLVVGLTFVGVLVTAVTLDLTAHAEATLIVAAVIAGICISMALHAYIWSKWIRKREQLIFELMLQKQKAALNGSS